VYATADLHEIRQTTTDSTTPSSPTEGWGLVSARGPGRGRPTRGDYRNANLDGSSDFKDDATPATTSEPSDAEHDLEEDADSSEDEFYADSPYATYGGIPTSSAATSSGSTQQPGSSGSEQQPSSSGSVQQPGNSSQEQGSSQDIEPYTDAADSHPHQQRPALDPHNSNRSAAVAKTKVPPRIANPPTVATTKLHLHPQTPRLTTTTRCLTCTIPPSRLSQRATVSVLPNLSSGSFMMMKMGVMRRRRRIMGVVIHRRRRSDRRGRMSDFL
jgi:hypothetical protein